MRSDFRRRGNGWRRDRGCWGLDGRLIERRRFDVDGGGWRRGIGDVLWVIIKCAAIVVVIMASGCLHRPHGVGQRCKGFGALPQRCVATAHSLLARRWWWRCVHGGAPECNPMQGRRCARIYGRSDATTSRPRPAPAHVKVRAAQVEQQRRSALSLPHLPHVLPLRLQISRSVLI
jgi:hypothetical protein